MYRMICNICKRNPAMRKVVTFTKEKKEVQYICDDCYHKRQQSATISIIKGIASNINSVEKQAQLEHVCKVCGTKASGFMQTGIVGCDNCYVDLAPEILQMIRATQGQINHLGKTPYDAEKEEAMKATEPKEPIRADAVAPEPEKVVEEPKAESEVLKLKKALEAAVQMEEYEKAIALRDQLATMTEEDSDA